MNVMETNRDVARRIISQEGGPLAIARVLKALELPDLEGASEEALRVFSIRVRQWRARGIPPEYVIWICAATGMSPAEVRPGEFPPEITIEIGGLAERAGKKLYGKESDRRGLRQRAAGWVQAGSV